MANIYDIQEELLSIFNAIEENEGELTPELEEALTIKQEEFNYKVKSYGDVIKQLELDIFGIKQEKDRLNELQKSKEKTIERLKSIIIQAINLFGDTSKSGSKFVDYGTGKISIRKSETIELDDDKLKSFTKRFINYFSWLKYTNSFEQEEYNVKDIVNYCNTPNNDSEDYIESNFTEDDLNQLQAELDFKVNLNDIISTEKGRKLIQAVLDYDTTIISKPSVDKKAIKASIKDEGICPTFAKLVTNQNITIK